MNDKHHSAAGKTALITGSARGIGAGIARLFAINGINVAINYRRSREAAEQLKEEIEASGGTAAVIQADVTKEAEMEKLVRETGDRFGGIDILVNNAGDFLYRDIRETTADEFRYMLESNLISAFNCINRVIGAMRENRWGRIINVGDFDIAKNTARPMKAAYLAAKSGLLQLTRSYARAEAANGITVNMVSPGYIDSGNYSESFKTRIAADIPAGRLGIPADVAPAILFLASEEAGYITGANIDVTGGADF